MNYEELKNLALESGFTHAAPLDTATIELKQDVRDMCAQGCQQGGHERGRRNRPPAQRLPCSRR